MYYKAYYSEIDLITERDPYMGWGSQIIPEKNDQQMLC
jgi:hypothetical protein